MRCEHVAHALLALLPYVHMCSSKHAAKKMFFDNLYTKNTIMYLFVFELNSNANEDALKKRGAKNDGDKDWRKTEMERILFGKRKKNFFRHPLYRIRLREDTYEGNTCGQDSTQLSHYHPLPVAQ